MKNAWSTPAMLAAVLLCGTAASSAQADGEKLFKQQCAACHAVTANAPPGMGPNLHAIIGREAGALAGFPYSKELKKGLTGKNWNPELLDAWLEDPQELAPGNYMMYKQADAEIRKEIITYLKTVK